MRHRTQRLDGLVLIGVEELARLGDDLVLGQKGAQVVARKSGIELALPQPLQELAIGFLVGARVRDRKDQRRAQVREVVRVALAKKVVELKPVDGEKGGKKKGSFSFIRS